MRILRCIAAAAAALAGVRGSELCGNSENPGLAKDSVLLYVGTYTHSEPWVNGTGQGVYAYRFNTTDGSLAGIGLTPLAVNPTYVTGTHDENRPLLYVSTEESVPSELKPGTLTGHVYAFQVDTKTGGLTMLNRKETGGNNTIHVSVSPNEDFVAVANYAGGSVGLFPLDANGALMPMSDFHQYDGGSLAIPARQEAPHLHSMTWVGGESTGVLGADLGNDRIVQYNLDAATGKIVPNPTNEFITRPPGAAPRHMTIHPSKKFAYNTDELANTVGVYQLDAAAGTLSPSAIQRMSTLPPDFTGGSAAADLHVLANGEFLYASNRGHDSIAIFKINGDGTLTTLGFESTHGRTPRAFQLFGDFLVVANQDSNSIEVFSVDAASGKLTYLNQSAAVGSPVSIFIPRYN